MSLPLPSGPARSGQHVRAVILTLVLAAGLAVGAAAATSPTKPKNTVLPSIVGTPTVGQTLTAGAGAWAGTTPIKFYYQWARSNAAGGFDPIPGATQSNYMLAAADSGHKLFVQIKAQNAGGVAWVNSKPTAAISALPAGSVMQISSVALPNRLLISGLSFADASAGSGRASIQARFRVTDSQGHPVQGALVKAIALPFGWTRDAREQATGADGWTSIVIAPTKLMPMNVKNVAVFVRARKPGDSMLGGVSTRRLVKAGFAV
jgi:hypothetical protein